MIQSGLAVPSNFTSMAMTTKASRLSRNDTGWLNWFAFVLGAPLGRQPRPVPGSAGIPRRTIRSLSLCTARTGDQ